MTPAVLLGLIFQYRYLILLPAGFLASLLASMLTGVAIRLDYLSLLPAYALLMAGELLGDIMWYWVGYHFGERFVGRFGKYVGLDRAKLDEVKKLFSNHNQRILISSKLTNGMGLAIPILFTAGMTRMSFMGYMWANISAQFFWTGGLIAVGYYFGNLYLSVNNVFDKISIVVGVLIFIALFFGFVRYLRSRLAS